MDTVFDRVRRVVNSFAIQELFDGDIYKIEPCGIEYPDDPKETGEHYESYYVHLACNECFKALVKMRVTDQTVQVWDAWMLESLARQPVRSLSGPKPDTGFMWKKPGDDNKWPFDRKSWLRIYPKSK